MTDRSARPGGVALLAIGLLPIAPALAAIVLFTPARLALDWPGPATLLVAVLLLPVLEEIVFRAGVHDALARRLAARLGPLTLANALTAAIFATAHLWHHPPSWALATALPALMFGYVWEARGRLIWPIGLHGVYNLVFECLLRFG